MIKLSGHVQGVPETLAALQQAPKLLMQVGVSLITETMLRVSTLVRSEHMQGPYPEEIQSRSGSLARTFAPGHPQNIFRVEAQGAKIIGTFGSTDIRARVLNEGSGYLPGGVIRSSRAGGYLAIRTDFTKSAGGIVLPRYRGPLRDLPNTFVRSIRSPRAKAAVFERRGGRIVPIAWLVREVRIRGRHFIEKSLAQVQTRLPALVAQHVAPMYARLQALLNRRGPS